MLSNMKCFTHCKRYTLLLQTSHQSASAMDQWHMGASKEMLESRERGNAHGEENANQPDEAHERTQAAAASTQAAERDNPEKGEKVESGDAHAALVRKQTHDQQLQRTKDALRSRMGMRKELNRDEMIQRDYERDFLSKVGTKEVVSVANGERPGFHCSVSGHTAADSLSYLDHINGRKRALLGLHLFLKHASALFLSLWRRHSWRRCFLILILCMLLL